MIGGVKPGHHHRSASRTCCGRGVVVASAVRIGPYDSRGSGDHERSPWRTRGISCFLSLQLERFHLKRSFQTLIFAIFVSRLWTGISAWEARTTACGQFGCFPYPHEKCDGRYYHSEVVPRSNTATTTRNDVFSYVSTLQVVWVFLEVGLLYLDSITTRHFRLF
jgi:hypothetical protein